MGIFGKKNKEGNMAVNLNYIDGIESYNKGTAVVLSLNDENKSMEMKARVYKKPPVFLQLEQITGVEVISEKDIIEKGKSTIGRAMVGGVFLGPLGAIVGGMSGIGNKNKSETHYFMIVNYKSKDEEIKVLSFEIVGASLHWSSFVEEFRKRITTQKLIEKEIYL